MTAETRLEPLEVIRHLRSMYGVAITKAYTEPPSTRMYLYVNLAKELHHSMLNIAVSGADRETEINDLAGLWRERAEWSDDRGLLETWADNVRSIG